MGVTRSWNEDVPDGQRPVAVARRAVGLSGTGRGEALAPAALRAAGIGRLVAEDLGDCPIVDLLEALLSAADTA